MTENNNKIKEWPVVGHKNIVYALKNNIKKEMVSHAYLFTGPKHIGKSMVAQCFSKTLMCVNDNKPCGECSGCKSVGIKSNSDYYYINGSKEKIKIEQIRSLHHKLSLSSSGKYKTCIINGIDNFTIEAANSILKLLEEPKGRVVFILIANSIENILPTIISRCTVYRFGLVGSDKIIDWLNGKVPQNGYSDIISIAAGRPGMAMELTKNEGISKEINSTLEEIVNIFGNNLSKSFNIIGGWLEGDEQKINKLDILLQFIRDIYMYNVGADSNIIFRNKIDNIKHEASKYSCNKLEYLLTNILYGKELISQNVNRKLVLENIALAINDA